MLFSPLDNNNLQINRDATISRKVTKLEVNGSFLEIEGYAYVDGLLPRYEDRIRKTLLIVPNIDIKLCREDNPEYECMSDEEIIDEKMISISLDNCLISELSNFQKEVTDKELKNSIGGYKGVVNLSSINKGQPLYKGEYDCFIKIEQLEINNDNIKYEKILPISDAKGYLRDGILNTKLEFYSSKKVLKYNLILSFNKTSKTLFLKNSLLQSFDPRVVEKEHKEGKYTQAIKRRLFKLMYILFSILPINNSKITFASDSRTELNGNLYFVYEELYKRNLNINTKIILSERIDNKKSFIDLVKISYQFATSKIILLDDFYPLVYPLRIRKNSDLIQVWHAAGAFKTFGYSRIGRPGGPSPHSKNHRNYTKAVVSSEGVRKNYAEGFGIEVEKIYSTGIPRSDIFFDEEYKEHVKKTIEKNTHLLRIKK
nr:CDP-glycerol glycerophosphotransferase family protein [Virgibacillus sp. SK37]